MAFKIYVENNHIVVQDLISDKEFRAASKEAMFFKDRSSEDTYNTNGFFPEGLQGLKFSDIVDENEIPFTNEQSFIDFFSTNTGNFNQGGATPQFPNGFEETVDGDFIIVDENENIAFKIFSDGKVEFYETTQTTKNLFQSTSITKIKDKKISILGDSISTTTGGGTGISENDTYAGLLRINDNCQIFRSTVAGTNIAADFTADARVNSLNSVFEPDVILVFGGVNDFLEDTPLGVFGDTTTSTFYGGLDVLCKKLLTRYPNTRIFFMTPLHHRFATAGGLIPEFNGTNFMTEFVDAIEKVCKRYGIPIINTNQNSGITCYNINTLSSDSIHVRELGHQMIYKTIINETNFLL